MLVVLVKYQSSLKLGAWRYQELWYNTEKFNCVLNICGVFFIKKKVYYLAVVHICAPLYLSNLLLHAYVVNIAGMLGIYIKDA